MPPLLNNHFLRSLTVTNLLSFGEPGIELDLLPLNVLIGPNGSGKSNLIDIVRFISYLPTDLAHPIHQGGGVDEWFWKGGKERHLTAELRAKVEPRGVAAAINHTLNFITIGPRLLLARESIEREDGSSLSSMDASGGEILASNSLGLLGEREPEMLHLDRSEVRFDQSILAQRRDPRQYLDLFMLGDAYESIAFFTEWTMGRDAAPRLPQRPDLSQSFLGSGAANLALVLNDILLHEGVEKQIVERLQVVYERATGLRTRVEGGTVQLFLRERGLNSPTPASRLSDGTLRFLALLAILYHPKPPPLVCIEEPELGLHPDTLSTVAEMLTEASQRMQLLVTTHSDLLVSHFSDIPESVVVCDRGPDGTYFQRLPPRADQPSEEEPLGDRWLKGQIGGTRW